MHIVVYEMYGLDLCEYGSILWVQLKFGKNDILQLIFMLILSTLNKAWYAFPILPYISAVFDTKIDRFYLYLYAYYHYYYRRVKIPNFVLLQFQHR